MIQANFRRICKESKNWEHKGAYIYPPICTKRLIFGKWTFFCFALSEYAFQSHNFTNWNFCDVTLIFSIYAFLHHAYISSFFYLRLESAFRCFRCACTLINKLNWFFFIPHGSPPQTKQAPCLNLLVVNSGFPLARINLSPFTKHLRGGEQMN